MPDDSGGSNLQNKKSQPLILRIFGAKDKQTEQIETEEEILSLVDKGKEKGIIEKSTKDVITNIFDFDDTVVSEIMTHRIDMVAVADDDAIDKIVKKAIKTGYSRIPVYHGAIDNIVGVLYVKDLLKYVCNEIPEGFKVTNITRDVIYVPRTKKCAQLFTEMTKHKVQLAIVVDEYGGTEGLITMEDLIEAILGNIQDEYDNEEDAIKIINENKFTVDGSTPVEEVTRLTGVTFAQGDYDTIAGYILEQLDHVPDKKEKPVVTLDGLKLSVLKIEDRRIAKVLIEKKPKETTQNND